MAVTEEIKNTKYRKAFLCLILSRNSLTSNIFYDMLDKLAYRKIIVKYRIIYQTLGKLSSEKVG